MDSILLNHKSFQVEIKRKPIRSLRLRLTSPDTISVSCPRFAPLFEIKKFITANTDWIIKNSQKFTQTNPLLSLSHLTILDESYSLTFHQTPRDSLVIFENDHHLSVNLSAFTETHLQNLLLKKLKPFAFKLIKSELKNLSLQYSFHYQKVTARNQRSRFGSCSSRGNLNFNWQIIFFPYDKFRHILLHEAAHLTHHNHSSKFWQLLASYDPEWRLNRLWIKKEGSKHYLIKP